MTHTYWETYEKPFDLPRGTDFATMSNEDNGFTTALTSGSANTYEFAAPYPSSIDLFDQTVEWFKSDYLYLKHPNDVDNGEDYEVLGIENSMLQIEHGAAYNGAGADVEDEAHKSKFAGPFSIGMYNALGGSASAGGGGVALQLANKCVMQYSPLREGIDLLTPRYEVYYGLTKDVAEATGALSNSDFDDVENVSERQWVRPRMLTRAEKDYRNISTRFQIIDT